MKKIALCNPNRVATHNLILTLILSLGLLAGGCTARNKSTTYEVGINAHDMVLDMAKDPNDSLLLAVLREVNRGIDSSGKNYVDAFFTTYQKYAPGQLSGILNDSILNTTEPTDETAHQLMIKKEMAVLGRAAEIIRYRADKRNLKAVVNLDAGKRVIIINPRSDDDARELDYLTSGGNLEFFSAYNNTELTDALIAANETIVRLYNKKTDNTGDDSHRLPDTAGLDAFVEKSKLETGADHSFFKVFLINDPAEGRSPVIGYVTENDKEVATEYMSRKEFMNCFPPELRLRFGYPTRNDAQVAFFPIYAIKTPQNGYALIDGSDISDVTSGKSESGEGPVIEMQMTAAGREKWREMTAKNLGKNIAILYDNKVLSCPRVEGVIATGNTVISGSFTKEEAKNMSSVLSSGNLPYPLYIVRKQINK